MMVSRSIHLALLKFSIAGILAAWSCVWILKPTRLWKRSWHRAEDWADSTFLSEPGLNVVVFCLPILAAAVMGYIYLHLTTGEGRIRRRKESHICNLSNPIIIGSPMGMVSTSELIAIALFILFLVWTYYANVSSDLKKMTPSKTLTLNRWQLKVMSVGVRFGSLTEACLVLLLLPVLRGMSLFALCGIHFEASVRYHVWLGNAIIFFSALHGTTIMCVWGSKNSLLKEITRWQRTGRVNIAGEIALVAGAIIWITSLPQIRRKNFQLFYFAHHLYVIFLIFFLLHAGAGHFYYVFSGVLLFALDKILRIIQSRRTTRLISARILPCKAVELTLPKEQRMQYAPMSTLFVKIPSVSRFQWHPFSITSSSNVDDDRLSLVIKCQGPWTNSLYDKLQSIEDDKTIDMKSISVAVEGPYGPAGFTYKRYDSLVLIAGGSGITPFLSILQDAASRNGSMNDYCKSIQLVYAVRKSQDLSMLAPVSNLLLNLPTDLPCVRLRAFVTKETEGSRTPVEAMLYEMAQVKTISLYRDPSASRDGFSRPEGLLPKAIITGLASVVFLVALVCLTHVFIHKGRRTSTNSKSPSWIGDLLVLFSFLIATSCSAVAATILCTWPSKSMKDHRAPAASHQNARSYQMNSERIRDILGLHEIKFGQRPNIKDILLEQSSEAAGLDVGVFVCGPVSMQESVASLCQKYSRKCGRKNKCFYDFHSINFSL